jgi:hypothetical protein
MAGLDSTLASLLASRTDLLLSAIRPVAGAATGTASTAAAQTGASQFYVDTAPTPATSVPSSLLAPPAASAQTLLSDVARTLDAISRFGGDETPPLQGNLPLWPTAPRPVIAASAFASVSDSLFSSRAAAQAASAAGVADTPAPPLSSNVLASTLAKTVDTSGLFYEAHIVQWLAGQRPLAALSSEPQALAGAPLLDMPELQAIADEVPWVDESLLSGNASGSANDPMNPVRLVQAPQTPQQAAALAATVRNASPSQFSSASSAFGTLNSADNPTAFGARSTQPQDPAVQASIASGIDPSTIPLVRQQLDVFATQQFRWSGEAWPKALLDWEIEPYRREAGDAEGIDAERSWRTRVTLSLPTLGHVDADLVLSGQQLIVRLSTGGNSAIRLSADSDNFRQQLAVAGLQLTGLTVRATDAADDLLHEAQDGALPEPGGVVR